MPLSMNAIAGACGAGPVTAPVFGSKPFQSMDVSLESGHICASW